MTRLLEQAVAAVRSLPDDVQDDLARLVGQAPAREIARVAGGVASGMREAARTLSGLVATTRK